MEIQSNRFKIDEFVDNIYLNRLNGWKWKEKEKLFFVSKKKGEASIFCFWNTEETSFATEIVRNGRIKAIIQYLQPNLQKNFELLNLFDEKRNFAKFVDQYRRNFEQKFKLSFHILSGYEKCKRNEKL